MPEICSPIANKRLAKAQRIEEFAGIDFYCVFSSIENENFYSHQMKVEVQNVDSDLISSLNKLWQIEGNRTDDDTDGVIGQFSRDIFRDLGRCVTKLHFRHRRHSRQLFHFLS